MIYESIVKKSLFFAQIGPLPAATSKPQSSPARFSYVGTIYGAIEDGNGWMESAYYNALFSECQEMDRESAEKSGKCCLCNKKCAPCCNPASPG